MGKRTQKSATSCRSFTLLDAMLAVAAVAVSFYVLRLHHSQSLANDDYTFRGEHLRPWTKEWLIDHSAFWMGWTFCWLIPCSWFFLIIRLRQPRPRLRRLFQQPGMAAITSTTCFTAIAGSMYAIMHVIGKYVLVDSSYLISVLSSYHLTGNQLEKLVADGGIMALSAWIILALIGRCRPEPGWIDPIGRVLGACWIVAWLLHYAHFCLY